VYAEDYVKIKIHGMRDTVGMRDTMSMLKYIGCETLCVDEKASVYAVSILEYIGCEILYMDERHCVCETLCVRETLCRYRNT